jgi:PhzF family phenazine biosynthesis protein
MELEMRIVQVDAFTNRAFAGNPAGVCVLPEPRDEAWMRNVAREMNLSETAFLVREGDAFHLRWFTPAVEVTLCGHATLASAHVLFTEGYLRPGEIARFDTLSGRLTAERDGDWIVLDFPAKPDEEVTEPPADLIAALGLGASAPVYVGKNGLDYVVEVASAEIVRNLAPDISRLAKAPARGVIVTARSEAPEYDFVSRFFAPAVGVAEDPVTGSAHCCLTPYWAKRLGKTEMTGYQASARGGVVRVALVGDRVKLAGQAVTVLRGELLW